MYEIMRAATAEFGDCKLIPLYQPYLTGKEKEYVNECLDTTWISSKGDFIKKFESEFAKFVGVDHATSVCNGTVALHLALLALGVKPGDEVIVPTLTYVASVNTIVQAGAIPVFVDSLLSTWQMDPEDVRRKVTPRTRAIMAVHLYGLPCEMQPLVDLCQEHDLYLIEDCAEALGSEYNGQHIGTFGDIATFSFYGNKTITTGEGGMVISQNAEIIQRAYLLKTQGVSPIKEYWHEVIGYNYRMTNICAAIGLAQMERLDDILLKKRQIAVWYQQKLRDLQITFQKECTLTKHSFWLVSILVESPELRESLRAVLRQAGVETRPVFHPIHTLPSYFKDGMESFPVATSLSQRGFSLPSWPGLTEEMVDYICQVIRDYYDRPHVKLALQHEAS